MNFKKVFLVVMLLFFIPVQVFAKGVTDLSNKHVTSKKENILININNYKDIRKLELGDRALCLGNYIPDRSRLGETFSNNHEFLKLQIGNQVFFTPMKGIIEYFDVDDFNEFMDLYGGIHISEMFYNNPKKDSLLNNGHGNVIDLMKISGKENGVLTKLTRDFVVKGDSDKEKMLNVINYIKNKGLYYSDIDDENQIESLLLGRTRCLGVSSLQSYLYDKSGLTYRFVWEYANADYYQPSHVYVETLINDIFYDTDINGLLLKDSSDKPRDRDITFKYFEELPGIGEDDCRYSKSVKSSGSGVVFEVSPPLVKGKYSNNIISLYRDSCLGIDDYLKSIDKE